MLVSHRILLGTAGLALFGLALVAKSTAWAQEESPPTADAAPQGPAAAERASFAGTAPELAAAHAHVNLRTIGRSAGDRALELITIGDADAEWAALIVARTHGRRAADESQLALDIASWLAEHTDELPPGAAFHVLAEASPDAAAAKWPRAGNARPVDEDADGDVDEDGADDVNADGAISWMRYPDPTGDWSFDEEDRPVRADPAKGIARTHRIVPEGRDDDNDGAWNEDGQGGVDISRNFTWAFEEHVAAAGRWPASEVETRAIMNLILADERIALVYEIGGADCSASTPGSTSAWPNLPDDDGALMAGLQELHGKGAVDERRSHAPGHGSLGGVVWHQLGRIWVGRAPLDRVGAVWPDGEAVWPKHLSVTWTPVAGDGLPPGAELATIAPHDAADAPPAAFAETPAIGEFLCDAATARASVAFTETVTAGASGVLRLRTRLVNTGRLPTHTARGAELRARRPLNVRVLLPDGATLAGGRPLIQIERLAPGGSSDEMAWVVSGRSGDAVRIEVTGPDTGTVVHEERIP